MNWKIPPSCIYLLSETGRLLSQDSLSVRNKNLLLLKIRSEAIDAPGVMVVSTKTRKRATFENDVLIRCSILLQTCS